jgi:uncharacterized protein DUF4332
MGAGAADCYHAGTLVPRIALRVAFVVFLLAPAAALANPYAIAEIPRMIPARDARRLIDANIRATDDLLREAATADGRKQVAKKTGLRAARVEQLARYADLLRLQNIGPEWVMLLEAARVKSIADLAQQSAAALAKKMAALNRTRHIANPAPTEAQVLDWITQAGQLPPVLTPG